MRNANIRLTAAALLLSCSVHAQSVPSPVLAYDLAPGEIAHLGKASVRIFADARVQLRRPVYWRDAGTFERQLPLDQVTALLQQALSLSVDELSPDVLGGKRAETGSAETLFEVHDADRVTLVVRQLGIEREIVIDAPAAQVARLPDLPALAAFADLDRSLRALLDSAADGGARRIPDEELAP